MISTALFAHGIHIFKRHHIDGAPQGIFCANGQCGQCMVLADRIPVKSCLTPVTEGMSVESLLGLAALPEDDALEAFGEIQDIKCKVLIIGGGPAGLSAAIELGKEGVETIIVDDKLELGGKLSLQTHNFFGSTRDCMAGTRGMDIGVILDEEVKRYPTIDIWLNSPAVGVFSDKKVGIVKDGSFVLVEPEILLVATGAREKALAFPGCDLPGVYGAGAFQTLVNRDLIKASDRLFIVGGGNVGLIAAYHAMQAGINVQGLVEALPACGGYKVHLDKIKRLGVPIYTSNTILKAHGDEHVEKVTIAAIDKDFKPVPGTESEFDVDTVLIAVGLEPVNELTNKARKFGMKVYDAGDASVIAEASAAMFSGRIEGRRILKGMGSDVEIPVEWEELVAVLRSKPGSQRQWAGPDQRENDVYPILRCIQEIPCNPCTGACPSRLISIRTKDITGTPKFEGDCLGCGRCVALCPGLAITVVDRRYDETKESALVLVPWELPHGTIHPGDIVAVSGFEGNTIGQGKVIALKGSKWQDRRTMVALEVSWGLADDVAGIKVYVHNTETEPIAPIEEDEDEIIVCRCERVTKGEIRKHIRAGARDFNSLKAATRIGMGECGGKTCISLIWRIFREEGVDLKEVEPHFDRPLVQEVPMHSFLGGDAQ